MDEHLQNIAKNVRLINSYLQVTEALGQSTAWTGNGDKSGLDRASDTFVNSDFLGVMKKFHFFAIRILKKKKDKFPIPNRRKLP